MARYRIGLVALVPISVACSDRPGGPPPTERSADRLWIYATGLSLAPDDTVRIGVTAGDSAVTTYVQYPDYLGNRWPDSLHIRWWVADTSRATVDASGLGVDLRTQSRPDHRLGGGRRDRRFGYADSRR